MAMPTNAFAAATLYPAAAASTQILREDLLDAAINLDKQKKAAVFLAAPKTTANGFVHEWLLDQLPGTSTAGNVEGNDWSGSAGTVRVRLSNFVQTFRRDFSVTMDQVEYSLKGRAPSVSNEYEHQVENFLLATEQSVDARMVANVTVAGASAAAATDTATMATMRGYQASASGAAGVATSAAVNNSPQVNILGAWSRTRFMALHEYMFGLGSDPDTLAVDPGVKADITNDILGEVSAATGQPANASAIYGTPQVVRQIHTDSSNTEYTADVQFMRTDFGRVAILVDRFIPQSATAANSTGGGAFFLYERSKVRVAFWRPLRHYSIAPAGDAMKGYVHTGVTMEVLHPRTLGIGYNITT